MPADAENICQPSPQDQILAQQQVVLILVGLIGSGKSTFAQALQAYFPHFRRCSQDDLGDRRAVEALARSSLREGSSVCIDRTNVDTQQRSTWIRIAREFSGLSVWVLEFDTPYEVCEQRLMSRTSHPTITSPELGLSILRRFRTQYQPPEPREGYDQMLSLHIDNQPPHGYSAADVSGILTRLQQTPRISPSAWRPVETSGRGGRGGYRGTYGNQRGHEEGGHAPRGLSLRRGSHTRGRGPWFSPPQPPWQSADKDHGTSYDANWRRPQ